MIPWFQNLNTFLNNLLLIFYHTSYSGQMFPIHHKVTIQPLTLRMPTSSLLQKLRLNARQALRPRYWFSFSMKQSHISSIYRNTSFLLSTTAFISSITLLEITVYCACYLIVPSCKFFENRDMKQPTYVNWTPTYTRCHRDYGEYQKQNKQDNPRFLSLKKFYFIQPIYDFSGTLLILTDWKISVNCHEFPKLSATSLQHFSATISTLTLLSSLRGKTDFFL